MYNYLVDENEKPPILNYNTPTSPSPYTSPFLKSPPRAAWIGGGIFLSILVLISVCFLLRSIGLWSDHMAILVAVTVGVLFMLACTIMTTTVFRAILKHLLKK